VIPVPEHVLLHQHPRPHDAAAQLRRAHVDEVEAHSINLLWSAPSIVWKDEIFRQFPLRLDPPPLARLCVLFQPCGKGLQRTLHEQLVTLRKPSLCSQIHEKFLDIL
jgi:hypothetical protein